MFDWSLITIIATAAVSLGSFGISIYNARVHKDSGEIDNLRKIIDTQSLELSKLSDKVNKLEKRDRTKTEAIQKAYRCKKIDNDSECPVISHILEKYSQQQ